MSHWHGGFWIPRAGSEIVEPVHNTVVAYFKKRRLEAGEMKVTFTTRAGVPVVHVAVRGGDADGKGYNLWNHEHAVLGGDLAKALRSPVWAYAYEDQTGNESVRHFDSGGKELSNTEQGWDDFGKTSGLDSEVPEFWAALPLGKLAQEFELSRADLTVLLPYDTPGVSLTLDGDPNFVEAVNYFADGLMPMPDAARPGEAIRELFLPTTTAAEIARLTQRLGVRLGDVVFAAWSLAAPELYAKQESLVAPKVRLPTFLRLSDEGTVPALAATGGEKVALVVALPKSCAAQIRELANALDRMDSYVAQLAYRRAREALFRAERAEGGAEPSEEDMASMTLYFPEDMWSEDIAPCAASLRLLPDELVAIMWELTKTSLATLPSPNEGAAPPEIREPRPPSGLKIPKEGAAVSAPPKAGDKMAVEVEMARYAVEEVNAVASHLDRSRSWLLQKAWATARPRLLMAERV